MTTPAPRPAARRRMAPEERRAAIRAAAVAVALTEGLAAVTLRRVASETGVTASLVAHYEPSMDVLVGDTFTTIAGGEIAEVRAVVAAHPRPVDRLRALLTTVNDTARDPVGAIWSDAWSLGRTNPEVAAAARVLMDDWQDIARSIVTDGVRDGSMRADDPERVGLLLFALVDAVNGYALVDYRTRAERQALVVATIAQAVGLAPADLGDVTGR